MMSGSTILFYLLAAMTLISAMLAVTARKIFRAAIYLLFSLMGTAGIYFWLQYDFLAAVQIVVYVGGITVLIIFSIFLTQQPGERLPVQPASKLLLSALGALFGCTALFIQVARYPFKQADVSLQVAPGIHEVGTAMLSTGDNGFALPFEVISLLLLAAMVGCIVIAFRPKPAATEETEE